MSSAYIPFLNLAAVYRHNVEAGLGIGTEHSIEELPIKGLVVDVGVLDVGFRGGRGNTCGSCAYLPQVDIGAVKHDLVMNVSELVGKYSSLSL